MFFSSKISIWIDFGCNSRRSDRAVAEGAVNPPPPPQIATNPLIMKFIILFLLFVASRLTSSPGRAFVVLPTPSPHFYHRAAMLKKPTTSTLPAAIFVSTGRAATSILQAGREEVTVFDAEGELSWEEYKKLKPANEYKVNPKKIL